MSSMYNFGTTKDSRTTSASPSLPTEETFTLSGSGGSISGEQPGASTIQSSSSGNVTAVPSSESSSEGSSSDAPQSQLFTDHATTTSENPPSQMQYVTRIITVSDRSSGLVTFTTTVEAAPSTGGSGETTPTQTYGTSEPSSMQTPISTSYVAFPPAYIFDAVIDNQNYHLPSPDEPPMVVILKDGTFAELSHDQVRIGDEVVPMAAFSGTRTINQGGHKHELGKVTGEANEPPKPSNHGGGGGGGGLGAIGMLIGGVAKSAKGAADGVTQARKDVFNLASAGVTGGGGAVADTLTNAGRQVNGLVSSINGIQQSLPTDKLTQTGLKTVLDAQNLGRQASNWLTSTASLVTDLPEDLKKKVFDNIKDYAKEGGPLDEAGKALKAFEEFPWESELPQSQVPTATQNPSASATKQPSETSMPTKTASQESSRDQTTTRPTSSSTLSTETSSSTRSESASATPDAVPYVISSKDGTPLQTFKDFIQELDQSTGQLWTWDIIDTQMYLTNLTDAKAEEIKSKHNFIHSINPNGAIDEEYDGSLEDFRAVGTHALHSQLYGISNLHNATNPEEEAMRDYGYLVARSIVSRPDAPWWKKMISYPKRTNLNPSYDLPYWADDSGGRGTTIYVLDSGFDIGLSELADTGRTVQTLFAPNSLTLPHLPEFRHFPESIGGSVFGDGEIGEIGDGDHGTMMAIIAAGKTLGVAPNANLYLGKVKNMYKDSDFASNGRVSIGPVRADALRYVLNEFKKDITEKLNQNPEAKSVINISWGVRLDRSGAYNLDQHFTPFIEFCEMHKIPVVIAAGNRPNIHFLHDSSPQHLGTPENNVITVGAVKQDGYLWDLMAIPVLDKPGSVTVFAPGEDIKAPAVGGRFLPPGERSGTSQAAAITSGLIAYLYSRPTTPYYDGRFATISMKQLLVDQAWTRVHGDVHLPDEWPPITSLDVIYNLARGDGACIGKRDKANDTDAHCTLAMSSTSQSSTKTRPLSSKSTTNSTSLSMKNSPSTSESSFAYSTTTGTYTLHAQSSATTIAIESSDSGDHPSLPPNWFCVPEAYPNPGFRCGPSLAVPASTVTEKSEINGITESPTPTPTPTPTPREKPQPLCVGAKDRRDVLAHRCPG